TALVFLVGKLLDAKKDSLEDFRRYTMASAPAPLDFKVKRVSIPRRSDILLEGMTPKDAEGSITAEWVYKRGYSDDRVILYLHGGAYFSC
ncbi:hypothetical protein HK102_011154, partial [Quaeritorhiza haematococci]